MSQKLYGSDESMIEDLNLKIEDILEYEKDLKEATEDKKSDKILKYNHIII